MPESGRGADAAGRAVSGETGQTTSPRPAKIKSKRRGVVRLSPVDQQRLDAGEITDPFDAVGKPEPRSKHDVGHDAPSSDVQGHDLWLTENVPPHW